MKHPLATNMSPFLEPLSNVDLWISIEKKRGNGRSMNIIGCFKMCGIQNFDGQSWWWMYIGMCINSNTIYVPKERGKKSC